MKKWLSFILVLILFAVAGFALMAQYYPAVLHPEQQSGFSVLFLDVGQGDSALVQCDGHAMLIDGGDRSNSQKIYSVLKKQGISHLDLVVASHPHADHVGGLAAAFQATDAGLVLCSTADAPGETFQDFSRCASQKGNGIQVPEAGTVYSLGSAQVEILGLNAIPDGNDSSIILRVTYGQNSFLFTGDGSFEAEKALLRSGIDLHADVLKVGHHGSGDSTSGAFLAAVDPKYAVISVGKQNSYGHPGSATLELLRNAGLSVYRTDLQGDILITSDGSHLSVSPGKSASDTEIFTPGVFPEPTAGIFNEASQYSYIGNKNSMVFHLPNCPSTTQMKGSNKVFLTGTREDAVAQGYSPCGNCKP